MRIGVISEGHSDRAVITNIVTGITGLDKSDITAILPIYSLDQTDKSVKNVAEFGGWSVIKNECIAKNYITDFLSIDGNEFVVIHVDTAEAHEYGVSKPTLKDDDYCSDVRKAIIDQINSWLNENLQDSLLYAIAVEEIDAWVLTIYKAQDSSKSADAKGSLSYELGRKGISSSPGYDNYLKISENFKKKKNITKGKYLNYNQSLKDFYDEVTVKVLPKL